MKILRRCFSSCGPATSQPSYSSSYMAPFSMGKAIKMAAVSLSRRYLPKKLQTEKTSITSSPPLPPRPQKTTYNASLTHYP